MSHTIHLNRLLFSIGIFLLPFVGWTAKDRAPIHLQAQAQEKTREYNVVLTKLQEKYWMVNIQLRNDGNESFPVDVGKFQLMGSDGNVVSFSSIPDIPVRSLFAAVTVHPRQTVYGTLGFKLKSKQAYPVAIIYETTFLTSTGRVSISATPQPIPTMTTQPSTPREKPNITQPVSTPSPSIEDKEKQRIRAKAAVLATQAKDSALGEYQMEVTNRYIQLQDSNKSDYEKKKITFDQFMKNRDNLERAKKKELLDIQDKSEQVYQDTYTKYTTESFLEN